MIRVCDDADIEAVYAIINDAAGAYHGIIPDDRWHDPYMPRDELRGEIAAGVAFLGYKDDGELVGVMGVQPVKDVTLIRHAYVRTSLRRRGVGAALLIECLKRTDRPVLIGTWAAATWAISFYQKHGFAVIDGDEKNRLLKTYWSIPERQIETSVVLADPRWLQQRATSTL